MHWICNATHMTGVKDAIFFVIFAEKKISLHSISQNAVLCEIGEPILPITYTRSYSWSLVLPFTLGSFQKLLNFRGLRFQTTLFNHIIINFYEKCRFFNVNLIIWEWNADDRILAQAVLFTTIEWFLPWLEMSKTACKIPVNIMADAMNRFEFEEQLCRILKN